MASASLSSNWKSLQLKLDKDKKVTKPKSAAALAHEKRRKLNSAAAITRKRQRMESSSNPASAATQTPDSGGPHHVAQPPGPDLLAVLESPSVTLPEDIPNAGLTPGLEPGRYIAIDCEMVGVGPDPKNNSVLARVSAVDFRGAQAYDSFVQAKETVTDYRTPVSGITAELLCDARTLEQVRAEIEALLQGRVLVGHAVHNDLRVLMLSHPRRDVRDTSTFGMHREMCGRRPALRNLARRVLGVEIQGGEHSSVEDARVTMALYRRHKDAFDREVAVKCGVAKTTAGEEGQGSGQGGEQGQKARTVTRTNQKKRKDKK